jgi:hypothetical protein
MTRVDDERLADELERNAFQYFLHEVDDRTGLVRDCTRDDSPASIAGSGFALSCYVVAAERQYLSRGDAAERVRRALRFLCDAPQSADATATGHRGFYYHFLDVRTGRRTWRSELSTIDSTMAVAGALVAGVYFDGDSAIEREIRTLADGLYRRVAWDWLSLDSGLVSMGWRPKSGPIRCGWQGYSEALLLYVLALGSPTHPLPADSYTAWTATYRWKTIYGYAYVYAGPLFIHHLSHVWLDLRGLQDAYMRGHDSDYFENSRRATYVQREYARRNGRRWTGYSESCWGITASDGPGPTIDRHNGRRRVFFGYHARGAPYGPDDGTLSPWAVAASMPFAPEIVLPSIRATDAQYLGIRHRYGYSGSFNPSYPGGGWFSPAHYAINQGPVVLMIENHRSELVWRLMRRCPYVATGLRRAGFTGGWLV